MTTASALFEGWIRHRRMAPVARAYRYRVTYLYLDLGELETAFAGSALWSARSPALVWFRRADHLGDPRVPLDVEVRNLVEERAGFRPAGPVRVLTMPRYLGFGFNPVSFFYCWDECGRSLEAIVAEVNNTPWGERHHYVLAADQNERNERSWRCRFAKRFHVSPFMGMAQRYDWRFTLPGQTLAVHMTNEERGERLFDATLSLERLEISPAALRRGFARQPFMPAKALAAIYFQALHLWLARVPFHGHPGAPRSEADVRYA